MRAKALGLSPIAVLACWLPLISNLKWILTVELQLSQPRAPSSYGMGHWRHEIIPHIMAFLRRWRLNKLYPEYTCVSTSIVITLLHQRNTFCIVSCGRVQILTSSSVRFFHRIPYSIYQPTFMGRDPKYLSTTKEPGHPESKGSLVDFFFPVLISLLY